MAVGDVMHELADGPAAIAVGSVELRVLEPIHGFAQAIRQLAKDGDVRGTVFGCAWGDGWNRPIG